ncbi:MAG TPA: HAD family hydrolase [Euzebyales bacterium]
MRRPSGLEAVVFDVGEVLIDETRVWHTWADLLGLTRLTFVAALGAVIAGGAEHDAVFDLVAPGVDWHALEEEHERRYGGFTDADVYSDVRATLTAVRGMGLTVVVAGNQPARRRAQLAALDLPVDALATSDDLGTDKPAAAFFARVCELAASAPAGVLYVGDRIDNDVVPAARSGLRTAWLRRGPWGLLQRPTDDPRPDLVLATLADLPTALADMGAPG